MATAVSCCASNHPMPLPITDEIRRGGIPERQGEHDGGAGARQQWPPPPPSEPQAPPSALPSPPAEPLSQTGPALPPSPATKPASLIVANWLCRASARVPLPACQTSTRKPAPIVTMAMAVGSIPHHATAGGGRLRAPMPPPSTPARPSGSRPTRACPASSEA